MDHYLFFRTFNFRRHIAGPALIFIIIVNSFLLRAQTPFKVTIPGSAFSVRWQGAQGAVQDIATGRKFRGNSRTLLILQGALQMHPSSSADHKMQRLIVRFRTSSSMPTLQSVQLHNGSSNVFHVETSLSGDYTTRETLQPATSANTWVWRDPVPVSPQSTLHLEIQFPGGFEGAGTPEDFVLTGVEIDYPLKSLPLGTSAKANTGDLFQLNKPVENKPVETRKPITTEEKEDYAFIGLAISEADSMVAAFRDVEQVGNRRQAGFDMGIGITGSDKTWGPGKQWFLNSLNSDQQPGFKKAAAFALGRNNYAELAAKGMKIAAADPQVAAARSIHRSGLFWLGFDIATAIFGNPALGAQGNKSIGPGAENIRATASEGEKILLSTHEIETGFNASMAFHLARKY